MIRLFRLLIPISVLLLMVADLLVLALSFWAAAYLDSSIDVRSFFQDEQGIWRVLTTLGLIWFGNYFQDIYRDLRRGNRIQLVQKFILGLGLAVLGQALIGYLEPEWILPRRLMLLGCVFSLISEIAVHTLLTQVIVKAIGTRPLLFFGNSPVVLQLAEHLASHPENGLRTPGFLDDVAPAENSSTLPYLGSSENLMKVVNDENPVRIVIGQKEQLRPWWADDLLDLNFWGVQIEDAAVVYEETLGQFCSSCVDPLEFATSPMFQLSPSAMRIQTAYSFAVALVAGVACLPVAVLAAVCLRIEGRGPILMREERAGLHGVPFQLVRFGGQESREGELCLTPVGRLLRWSHLDGLPQLWNVLTTKMGIIGPRAERTVFANRLAAAIPFYRQRQAVKPGIFQWRGFDGGETPPDTLQRLEQDLYYAKHFAPSLDLATVMQVFKSVFD